MGRRSYSGEKRRKELARKAKREAKRERKEQTRAEGEPASGPPVDWDALVSGQSPPSPEGSEESSEESSEDEGANDPV